MELAFVCPTPGCETVIRKRPGLLLTGEPMIWSDEKGQFVQCPSCHVRISWPRPDYREGQDDL